MRNTRKNRKYKNNKGKKSQTRKISKSLKGFNKRIKEIEKKITGKPFKGTIGVVSKYVLNKSTPYIGKIPIAVSKSIMSIPIFASDRIILLRLLPRSMTNIVFGNMPTCVTR